MTHLDIINKALVAGGMNPMTSMGDTTNNQVTSVRAYYESCWKDVLSAHDWTDLLEEETMSGTLEGDKYVYSIPDQCIRLVSVINSYGVEDTSYRKRGRYLYSDYDEIELTYVSTSEILPIDFDFIDYELQADIPPTVDDAVSLRLASQIVLRLSQDMSLQQHLAQRYAQTISSAKMNDMVGYGGQDPWTGTSEVSWEDL